jgi:hypothetical protein
MLTFGSCFQSISSDGQSCLMKPPSSQKAKMLARELHLATDPELVAADLRAQELLFCFQRNRPGADTERCALLGSWKSGSALSKNIPKKGPLNRRSLHCAPPDFLSRSVALISIMRFSLRKTAYVVVASSAK